jgi:hypothetical protein
MQLLEVNVHTAQLTSMEDDADVGTVPVTAPIVTGSVCRFAGGHRMESTVASGCPDTCRRSISTSCSRLIT